MSARAAIALLSAACLCLGLALVAVVGLYRHDLRLMERNRSLEGSTRQYILAAADYATRAAVAEGRVNWLTHACAP